MQVSSDDFVRLLGGVRNPAGQLFHVELTVTNAVQRKDFAGASADLLRIEGESEGRFITGLDQATCKVNRSRIQPTRRARLESAYLKT